ncbi:MAG: GIY-YIG nuclease family protein [Prevotella sp.]|nr:GIY-YIG nuclease family protein [Prevotella sp.]
MEASLHRVYASKRIRGEWFNLDIKDIEDIKQTLK